LSRVLFSGGSWTDHSPSTSMSHVVFSNNPFVASGSVIASNTTIDSSSPVQITGNATFVSGSSLSTFFVGGDAKITNFTFTDTSVSLASLSKNQGGSSVLAGDTFIRVNLTVFGPGNLNNDTLSDSTLIANGGGTLSRLKIIQSNIEVGPVGNATVSLSDFIDSVLRFRSDGQIVADTFNTGSVVYGLDGAAISITNSKVPDIFCDSVSTVVNPGIATIQGGTTNCSLVGFKTLKINPGVHLIVTGGSLGGNRDTGATILVSQSASITIIGNVNSYSDIHNLGTVTITTDSSLTMFDASIHNEGHWIFDEGLTLLTSSSLVFVDPAEFPAWFHNAGGNVESLGNPEIGIKFNNTGGVMNVHVESTENNPRIISDFTFTNIQAIFRQSRFEALDRVTVFNYSSSNAAGTPLDPRGSFGLPFYPIITLAQTFSPELNGYFHPDPNFGLNDDYWIAGTPSCFVYYYYNDRHNQVPDERIGDQLECMGCPRIITVNISDPLQLPGSEPIYSNKLTLVASANINFASALFVLVWVFVTLTNLF